MYFDQLSFQKFVIVVNSTLNGLIDFRILMVLRKLRKKIKIIFLNYLYEPIISSIKKLASGFHFSESGTLIKLSQIFCNFFSSDFLQPFRNNQNLKNGNQFSQWLRKIVVLHFAIFAYFWSVDPQKKLRENFNKFYGHFLAKRLRNIFSEGFKPAENSKCWKNIVLYIFQ